MNYLKLFEDFRGYKVVSGWIPGDYLPNPENLNQSDLDYLQKELNSISTNVNIVPDKNLLYSLDIHFDDSYLNSLCLFKMSDEWFMVNWINHPSKISWKCDQLHGVVKCIKDNVIGKNWISIKN